MSDFLTRASKMALGVGPSVKPLIASRYAPGPETPLLEIDAVIEDSRASYSPSPQVETRRSSFAVGRPRSEPSVSQPVLGRPDEPVPEMTPAESFNPPVSEFPLDTSIQSLLRTSPVERSEKVLPITHRRLVQLDEVISPEVISPRLVQSNSVEETIAESRSESGFIPTPAAANRVIGTEPQQTNIISDDHHTSLLTEASTITLNHPQRFFADDRSEVTVRSVEHTSDEVRTTERVVDSINPTPLVPVPVRERSFTEVPDWRPREQTTPAAPVAPVVRVTIGRIEVQAAPSSLPPAEPSAPAGPKMSLDDYLRQYNRRQQ